MRAEAHSARLGDGESRRTLARRLAAERRLFEWPSAHAEQFDDVLFVESASNDEYASDSDEIEWNVMPYAGEFAHASPEEFESC